MLKNKYARLVICISFPLLALAVTGWSFFVERPLPCVIRGFTGLYCPACGATRAVMALLRGELMYALHTNAFVAVLALPIVLLLFAVFCLALFGRTIRLSDRAKGIGIILFLVLCGLFIVFGAVRNIPYYPFTELIPV